MIKMAKIESELKLLFEKHYNEINDLRKRCIHLEENIKIYEDNSVVGRGSAYPAIHITCINCGAQKIMFIQRKEINIPIERTLKRQKSIKDQRLNCFIHYEYELDRGK